MHNTHSCPARRRAALLLLLALLLLSLAAAPLLHAQQHFSTGIVLDNSYGFLDYWQRTHGALLLGEPVTEPLLENGHTVQYFERGRLEHHPELPATPVLAGRVGADYAAAIWRNFAPVPRPSEPGVLFFEATGHTLREPFARFWQDAGGLQALGYPISEPDWEYVEDQMLEVQYFERARLERHRVARGRAD